MMIIKSSFGDYSVEEMLDLDAAIALCADSAGARWLDSQQKKRAMFIIADNRLFELPHAESLARLDPSRTIKIEASEEEKSYGRIEHVFESLLQAGFRRGCTLVAIGGGVTQDITCFVASVLFRGVPWNLIPTTLLAQCDSCIGSKSSVNIGQFKNQIGTFYPPRRVFIVNEVLKTLSLDDLRSGLGEVIKLHLISGGEDYMRMREQLILGSPAFHQMSSLISSSLSIKKRFIEQDEFDMGVRNLLNYGHTFGHAYESVSSYSVPHGIAVTLGVVSATFVSERLGLAAAGHFEEVNELARPFYSPYEKQLAGTDVETILDAMRLDKKSTRMEVNCILTRGPGKMEKVALNPEKHLKPLLVELKSKLFA